LTRGIRAASGEQDHLTTQLAEGSQDLADLKLLSMLASDRISLEEFIDATNWMADSIKN
jgi:hypothetical protein